MTDEPRTVADGTIATTSFETAPDDRALLIVYYEQGPGGRSRLVSLPADAEVIFGRSRSSMVHVDSERVSRAHARLWRCGNDIQVEDLGSRNGTRVNGTRIDGPTHLRSGDEIAVGPVTAVLSVTTRMVRRSHVGTTAHLEERLAAEADRGRRYRRSFTLLMLRLEGAEAAVDQALDRLVAALRPMDTIAEYSTDEYAILLPEVDAGTGADMARQLISDARAQALDAMPCTMRAGLAVFPTHGSQAGAILARARAALGQACMDGGDEVAIAPAQEPAPGSSALITADPQMQRVYALVRKVADTGMTVLVVGETGAGKEVVAEQVHRASTRRDRPFVRLNCASIPETLLESELFGHERGAFTGADRQRAGYFEAADGGTLFLDEIGELSPGLQAKLLRVLEQRRFTRVGGTQEIEVDTRVVCATNRDLEEEVRQGGFREDLFFRISAFTVVVPPLRDRRAEILPLAEHFAAEAARQQGGAAPTLSAEARAALERYTWPGNVRELRNAMERACVLHDRGVIELDHLPDRVREAGEASALESGSGAPGTDAGSDVRARLAAMERAAIIAAMDACGGNQTHAARKLGMSRRALIYKLEKYGLKPKPGAGGD